MNFVHDLRHIIRGLMSILPMMFDKHSIQLDLGIPRDLPSPRSYSGDLGKDCLRGSCGCSCSASMVFCPSASLFLRRGELRFRPHYCNLKREIYGPFLLCKILGTSYCIRDPFI